MAKYSVFKVTSGSHPPPNQPVCAHLAQKARPSPRRRISLPDDAPDPFSPVVRRPARTDATRRFPRRGPLERRTSPAPDAPSDSSILTTYQATASTGSGKVWWISTGTGSRNHGCATRSGAPQHAEWQGRAGCRCRSADEGGTPPVATGLERVRRRSASSRYPSGRIVAAQAREETASHARSITPTLRMGNPMAPRIHRGLRMGVSHGQELGAIPRTSDSSQLGDTGGFDTVGLERPHPRRPE